MELSEELLELKDLLEYYGISKSNLNLTYLLIAKSKGIDVIKEMYHFDKMYGDLNKFEKQREFRDYFYKISKEVVEWEEE